MGAWPHCFTSSPDVPSRLQIWVSLLLLPWGGGGKWNWVGSLSPKLPLHWGQARVSKNANNFPTLLKMAFSGLDISSVFVNHCLSPRVLTKLVLTVSRLFQSFYGEQDLRDSKPITESFWKYKHVRLNWYKWVNEKQTRGGAGEGLPNCRIQPRVGAIRKASWVLTPYMAPKHLPQDRIHSKGGEESLSSGKSDSLAWAEVSSQ